MCVCDSAVVANDEVAAVEGAIVFPIRLLVPLDNDNDNDNDGASKADTLFHARMKRKKGRNMIGIQFLDRSVVAAICE